MKMFSSGRPHLAAPTAAETADQNYVKHIFGKIMMKNNFENIMMKKFFLIVFRCQSSSIPTYLTECVIQVSSFRAINAALRAHLVL